MMFGRQPRIPIDIIVPPMDLYTRDKILEEYEFTNELGEITVLDDEIDTKVEDKIPEVAKNY